MAREKIYACAADRVRAHRLRTGTRALTVELPGELLDEFEAFLKFKDVTKNAVIAKLIRTQLLRKR